MADIRDFRRDWLRWTLGERLCAVVLGGLSLTGAATAMLFNAHLL
jgi:hypothetical protein